VFVFGEHGREASARINPPEGATWFDREVIAIPVRANPPEVRLPVKEADPGSRNQTVLRGKVTRSWRYSFFNENGAATLIVISRRFCSLSVVLCLLFFVRVNQVLVRLWARAIRSAVRCGVVGSLTTDHRPLITDAVVRLMSDRESASGWQRPCWGFAAGRAPLNRTARVQRRVCELIRMKSVLLKEWN
jgi:hypothetical protein